jgi:TonB family protein
MKQFILIVFIFSGPVLFAQDTKKEAEVKELLEINSTSSSDAGLNLIQSGQYQQANQYFSTAITNDESNRSAYYKRGVANWALSDTVSACRDWSSVLALGDTEMFNLLESKCHSTMIIENDSIPAKQYKKIFATDNSHNSKSVVEVMPAYPGGQEAMMNYLIEKTPKINQGKRGTVYVNFTVSPKGKILYPYVKHGLGDEYDKAALKLVKNMPAWTPGKQKGKAVYVTSSIPIRFS